MSKFAQQDHKDFARGIMVYWMDASEKMGDHNFDDEMEPDFKITTYGTFLGEDENYIWLAFDFCAAHEWCREVAVIPKGMILRQHWLD